MAELLPSTEELGSGLLLDHSSPRDPITSYDPDVEIHHTELAQNAPDRKIDSPAVVVVVEEEGTATDEEVSLLDALERDLYRLTIEQAEIETGRETERLGAVNKDEGKDVGNMVLDVVHEEKGVNSEALSVEHESQNGLSYSEKNEGAEELDNGRGYVENEGILKFDNLHEEKDEKIEVSGEDENVNLSPYVENEEAVKLDNLHEVKGVKNIESVEDENVKDRWCYMDHMGVNEENQGAVTRFGRSNQNNYSKGINYPVRPDADDCTFYMRHGACKFGVNCKFNHPPKRKYQGAKERTYPTEENSERAGQTQCKYYLTSAGCKYGKDCKYSHGSDKISMSHHNLEFNFLGLPIRPEEKECSYYMRTGTCKYGSNCRFHHPEPTTVVDADSPSGYGNGGSIPSQHVSSSSWSPPRAFQEASSFTPFEAATYPTSERSLPTPPAFSLANMPTEMNFPMQHRHGMVVEEYPERMGEPECVFFMKTGDCKYKSNCKFHHPKNHTAKARGNQFTLNDKGLPLRPDQPICTHFHRYGICKYGPACKYDHPSGYGNSPMPYDHQPAF